jgi:hypothetical protein
MFDDKTKDVQIEVDAKTLKALYAVGNIAKNEAQEVQRKEGHIDTGASVNSKHFVMFTGEIGKDDDFDEKAKTAKKPTKPNSVKISTGMDYDIYLERRYAIMAASQDNSVPVINKVLKQIYGK